MLYKNREKFNNWSVKIGMLFSKIPFTPNQWTALSFLPAILCFFFLASQKLLLGAICFALAGFLDFVDGSVARVTGRTTKFGAYLDTIADRYVEFFAIAGLFFVDMPFFFVDSKFWVLFYLFGSTMTTYAKAAAKEKDLVQKEIKGGFFERAERLLVFFSGLLAGHFFGLFWLALITAMLGFLTNLTALQRIWLAKKNSLG